MTTIEDMLRMATQAGEGALIANIARAALPRTPADLLADIERAAGIATADTTSTEATAP